MSFKEIASINDITGLNLIIHLSSMLKEFPGENVIICGKVLHNYYRISGVKTSMFTPQHYYLKHNRLYGKAKRSPLDKILSSVSGNTMFVLIHAGTFDTKHRLYMRCF